MDGLVVTAAGAGTGGSDVLKSNPGWLGPAYKSIQFLGETPGLFEFGPHAAVVGRANQEGGIGVSALTVRSGPESIHMENPKSELYAAQVMELLSADSSSSGSEFAHFPAVEVFRPVPPASGFEAA